MSLQPLQTRRQVGPRLSFATKTHSAFPYPAPTKGLDYVTPFAEGDGKSGLVLSNVFTRTYGLEFRSGWRRNTSLIPGEIRTLMPYNPPRGLIGPGASAKLFAACSNGTIYDVTDVTNEVTVPPVSVIIPGQLEPGEFSWTNFATLATNYLCVCSSGGGYWTYDTTGGWIDRTASITGGGSAAAINFDFVMSWKNRLWFIRDQSNDTFFLGTNNIAGAASLFDFGPLMIHGGDIKAMASWTVDGGDGLDDRLVIVGSEGDVLIYGGNDPSSAVGFQIQGRWFVGRPPNGRRFMERYGGDLCMITQYGLMYMNKLVTMRGDASDRDTTASYKVNPILANAIRDTLLAQYWEVRYFPPLEAIVLNSPTASDQKDRLWVMDVNSQGWSNFDNVPMLTCELFNGKVYFGTTTGIVGIAFEGTVTTDGQLTDGTRGDDITVDVQTSFTPVGDAVRLKRMLQAQVVFQCSVPPAITAQINPDWSPQSTPGSPIFSQAQLALWDAALWDQATWEGGLANTYRAWFGASGVGYFASLRFKGRGAPKTVFINWTLVAEGGGLM